MNKGDVAVFNDNPTATRQSIINNAGQGMNIFPGEITLKEDPERSFQFYWFLDRKDEWSDQELDSLRDDEGYDYVRREHFDAKRWRWDEQGLLRAGRHICLYRDEARWLKERDRRIAEAQGNVGSSFEQIHAAAEGLGIETFEQKAGGEIVAGARPSRKYR